MNGNRDTVARCPKQSVTARCVPSAGGIFLFRRFTSADDGLTACLTSAGTAPLSAARCIGTVRTRAIDTFAVGTASPESSINGFWTAKHVSAVAAQILAMGRPALTSTMTTPPARSEGCSVASATYRFPSGPPRTSCENSPSTWRATLDVERGEA